MAVNKTAARKKAGSKKKTNFFKCDGCSRTFAAGIGITAPPNKHNLRSLCEGCYKKFIGSKHSPAPNAASSVIKSLFGAFMTLKQVKNGARPDAELFKKIIRCKKGEMAVDAGEEGAVKVEISAVQIGASRPWSYSQDSGNSKPGTVVYPVKATYTVKTFYRNATEVSEGWVRILNFYVNAFGQWQIGSEETIKGGKTKRIPKN
jgi:hypothetical protein